MNLGPLIDGFAIALDPSNLLFALVGVVIGTLVGMLPGIGPMLTMALLLPLTFGIPPASAVIMLAGIYYGSMYGGSTTAIMLNLPGETASVTTAIEGYRMRLQGRAGVALGIAAVGSFAAGTFAVLVLALLAEPMTAIAIALGVPETFVLLVSALALVGVVGEGSALKGLLMAGLGLLVAAVGLDVFTGQPRLTMGLLQLSSGFEIIAIVIGLFALGEVLHTMPLPGVKIPGLRDMLSIFPGKEDYRRSALPVARGSVFGIVIGLLPGAGPTIASYISYGVERRLAKKDARFGEGAVEGVAGPEAANNAGSTGAMIPLLTLGIPGSVSAAVLLSAFILYGLQPGPALFRDHPDVAWGLIASMFIGNAMLLILNWPLVGLIVQTLRVPYPLLSVATILLSVLGAYSLNQQLFDVWVMVGFGLLGWGARRLDYPLAPFVLALVLGNGVETTLRQSLLLTDSGVLIFIQRPVSAALLALVVTILLLPVGLRLLRRLRGH